MKKTIKKSEIEIKESVDNPAWTSRSLDQRILVRGNNGLCEWVPVKMEKK
jgi:hypothetical protein